MVHRIRTSLFLCFCILIGFSLSGCGFSPVYSKHNTTSDGTSVRQEISNTYVDIIPDREGVALRNHLIDKFYDQGTPSNPSYILKTAAIQTLASNLDQTEDAITTRIQIRLRTNFSVIDSSTGEKLTEQQVTAITSYNVLGSQFATLVSRRAAVDAAVEQLAEQIETRLSLFFSSL